MSISFGEEFDHFRISVTSQDGYYIHEIPDESGSLKKERWKRDAMIGHGSYGSVFMDRREDGELRAVKRISRVDLKYATRELTAFTRLKKKPEYFVEFRNWFEHDWNIYFVMDYFEHGNLAKFTTKKEYMRLLEEDTVIIVRQLVQGLIFMGRMDLCHRDLKPENVLVASFSPINIKIADFGLARSIDETRARTNESTVTPRVGTEYYIAPEVLEFTRYGAKRNGKYGKAVDYWSLGCLIHAIITGGTPFQTGYDALEKYCNARDDRRFPLTGLEENNASEPAIDFITSLMRLNPDERLKPEEAAQHPWLLGFMETLQVNPELVAPPDFPYENVAIPGTLHECDTLQCAVAHGSIHDIDLLEGVEIPGIEVAAILRWAATRGYLGVVERLTNELENAAAVVTMDLGHGWTALHFAAYNRHAKIVEKLLELGADISAVDSAGSTVLHKAATYGCEDTLIILFDYGADLLITDRDGEGATALHKAALHGHVGAVEILLENGAGIVELDGDGNTALQNSILHGHTEVVKLLLDRYPDDSMSRSLLLFLAASKGHIDVTKALLDSGVSINVINTEGHTVLQQATLFGQYNVVLFLLERGAWTESKSRSGWTALHIAVYNGYTQITIALLAHRANTTAMTISGDTPLHIAARVGYYQAIRALYKHSSYKIKNNNGLTPLDIAASSGHTEVVKELLEIYMENIGYEDFVLVLGSQANETYNDVSIALHFAAFNGHAEVIDILLWWGANVAAIDRVGNTALHRAALRGHPEAVISLLDNRADIEARNMSRCTALHIAAYNGFVEVVEILLGRRADITAKTKCGHTPLYLATVKKHRQVVVRLSGSLAPNLLSNKGLLDHSGNLGVLISGNISRRRMGRR